MPTVGWKTGTARKSKPGPMDKIPTRGHTLDQLPERGQIHSRISELLSSSDSIIYFNVRLLGDGSLLAMKRDPAKSIFCPRKYGQ